MPHVDLPLLGNVLLCTMVVSAAYTMGASVLAGTRRPHFLPAARWGTLATCALVLASVCVLAYAFQTHDFRIRYVSRYSDRSMTWGYLVTALWGGQDGSLLWWAFLLSVYTSACVAWLGGRKFRELQPWVFATLTSIFLFFGVLMLFAANPFATNVAGAPPDGEGLNPLLQNYWMAIHPPTLYSGFVGWSIPFAFVVAALVTGRLGDEWMNAIRRWVLVAWLALACGNLLGMLWSYEELGWGGYWAWDPVENAAFMPLLTGTAFLHSTMIQERRGMLKVWNVFLLCLTFIMTIFGTCLTRSGLIASVHSFARSDIGIYFFVYIGVLILGCVALVVWRLPKLRAENEIESLVSREFAFLVNNWILLGMMVFVLIATTFPLLSEAVRGEQVTVGPSFYNKWMVPLGLMLLFLTGVGPLVAWRKATGRNLLQALAAPTALGLVAMLAHGLLGAKIGMPAVVPSTAIYDTATGRVLAAMYSVMPLFSFALVVFVVVACVQEFVRGTRMRMRNAKENVAVALFSLVSRARRRYGGYLVHVAIALMFFGFTGSAYDVEREAALRPGDSMTVGDYTLRFRHARLEADEGKRELYADLTVSAHGQVLGRVSPAKFVYRTMPDTPTTEVAIASGAADDLYVILNSYNPESQVATMKVIVRPFVAWIWIAGLLLIFGAGVAFAPTMRELFGEARSLAPSRPFATAALLLAFFAGAAVYASRVHAQDQSSSLHAGAVAIRTPHEQEAFERLLCNCGDCQRLPLSDCACSTADERRAEVRASLAHGDSVSRIVEAYRTRFGNRFIAVPSDKGLDRALWAVPIGAIVVAAGGLVWLGRRWTGRGVAASTKAREAPVPDATSPEEKALDESLDDELRRFGDG